MCEFKAFSAGHAMSGSSGSTQIRYPNSVTQWTWRRQAEDAANPVPSAAFGKWSLGHPRNQTPKNQWLNEQEGRKVNIRVWLSHISDVWFMNIRYDMIWYVLLPSDFNHCVGRGAQTSLFCCHLLLESILFGLSNSHGQQHTYNEPPSCTLYTFLLQWWISYTHTMPSAVFLAPTMKAGNEPPISEEWKTYKIVIHPPNPKSSSVVPLLVLHLPGEGL